MAKHGKTYVAARDTIDREKEYAPAEAIAKQKLPDLNTRDVAGAVKIIEGTARSMGIEIQG